MSIATQNRNKAYFEITEKLNKKCQLILELIKENKGITRQELSDKYCIPINEVSGRITELEKMCLIHATRSSKNSITNKLNTVYEAIHGERLIIEMRNQKAQELIDIRNGMVNDYILGMSPHTKALIENEKRKIEKELRLVS